MRSPRDLLVVAVATPLVFLPVAVGLRWLALTVGLVDAVGFAPWQGMLLEYRPGDGLRYVVVLGVLGAGAVAAADRRVYAPAGVAGVGLTATAVGVWERSAIHDYGTVATLVFVLALLAGSVEWFVRNRHRVRDSLADEDVRLALALGLLHVSFGAAFFTVESGLVVAPRPVPVVVLALLVAGLGTLWAVPTVAYRRRGLVAPAVVAGGWFLWAVALYAQNLPDLLLSSFHAIEVFALEPYPGYHIKWTFPLALLLYAGLVEWAVREHGLAGLRPSAVRDEPALRDEG